MPQVKLNKKVFEKLVGKKLPDAKLKDRISYLGTDLDSIDNNEINVEIFPNRPDLLSEQGFARAFSSFIGVKTGLKEYKVNKSNYKLIVEKSVSKIRPYTACAVIKNLKMDDEKIREIIQIQEKLHITFGRNRKKMAIGIYPMEKINFPIRYLAKSPQEIKFKPLEFPRVITGHQILSQHPTGRDYGHLLEGYDKFPIFIDAKEKILSMPPIINSHDVGKISNQTKDVFIECSGFDFSVLSQCLNIIVTALADMGGSIYEIKLEYLKEKYVTPNLKPRKEKIRLDYVNKYLGLNLKEKEMKELLEKMGYGYSKGNVLVPAYRSDILHEIDFVEDIAIAYGYENFKAEIPNVATIGQEDHEQILINKIADILIGFGLLEVNTYNITNKFNQSERMNAKISVIELANALTVDYDALRTWVIPNLIQVLSDNKHNEFPQKIFEVATCFKKNEKEDTNVSEFKRLAVLLTHATADYTEIRQIFDALMSALDLKYEVSEVEHPSFISGRVGRVKVEGKDIAYIGEIHPQVLENWDLDYPIVAFELNITEIVKIILAKE